MPAEQGCPGQFPLTSHMRALVARAARWTDHHPLKIVAIGSSSTAGAGASSPNLAYPAQLQSRLRAAFSDWPIEIVNLGVGGEAAEATLRRLRGALKEQPSLVLWQVGTNDALQKNDFEAFGDIVDQGIAAARGADIGLVVIDQQFFPDIKDLDVYERFVSTLHRVADARSVPVFPRYTWMKKWFEAKPDLAMEMLSADKFHMSDRGYTCLAEALSNLIVQAVDDSRRPAMADLNRPLTTAGGPRLPK